MQARVLVRQEQPRRAALPRSARPLRYAGGGECTPGGHVSHPQLHAQTFVRSSEC